jgi:hypothetical protein
VRILVVLSESRIGAFIESGAFSAFEDDELLFVTPPLKHPRSRALLESHAGYLGEVDTPRETVWAFRRLENALMAARSRRASALRYSLDELAPRERRIARLSGLPGVNRLVERHALRSMGPADGLETLVGRLKPDLVIAVWSYWANALTFDAIRAARAHDVKSLMLNGNWDGVACSGGFPVRPDYLAVWGEQTIDHAVDIHDFPRERTFALGSPGFQHYFDEETSVAPTPFDFRYVLFAGTHARFDELEPLKRLDELIEARGLDLKIVYRPYPGRYRRDRSDFVDERELRHVVIDPDVRDQYFEDSGMTPGPPVPRPPYPTLKYFPALLGNAEFVICPFSTMLVEAALFDRRVIIPAFDDGVDTHIKLSQLVRTEVVEGMDRVQGFRIAHSRDELVEHFDELAGLAPPAPGEVRDDPILRWWLYRDERTYAQRLADLAEQITGTAAKRPAAMLK